MVLLLMCLIPFGNHPQQRTLKERDTQVANEHKPGNHRFFRSLDAGPDGFLTEPRMPPLGGTKKRPKRQRRRACLASAHGEAETREAAGSHREPHAKDPNIKSLRGLDWFGRLPNLASANVAMTCPQAKSEQLLFSGFTNRRLLDLSQVSKRGIRLVLSLEQSLRAGFSHSPVSCLNQS